MSTLTAEVLSLLVPDRPEDRGILLVVVFGSAARSDTSPHDLDVVYITSGEPDASLTEAIRAARSRFVAACGTRVDTFVMTARTLWEKLARGDVQVVSLFRHIRVVYDRGMASWISSLIQTGVIRSDPSQTPRLREYALRCLSEAKNAQSHPAHRLGALRTAARSAIQCVLLSHGVEPAQPRGLVAQLSELRPAPPGLEPCVSTAERFEKRLSELVRDPASVRHADVDEWLDTVSSLVIEMLKLTGEQTLP
ncbi:MAG: nucleotidyltransferase domain-containing protein [Acetobacteraceae bacterium]|nr:nucleotidyltransferase domain-containing protein [Acetobacteraceae bacterium]